MIEGRAFSIELVDADGRKVRVAVTGHWGGLNAEVAARVVDRLGYELSDMESWTPEPPSGTIIWQAPETTVGRITEENEYKPLGGESPNIPAYGTGE